jgi:carbonic anhydrase/acetyltransferase-like protein (isoleucine patch superfamily)
MRDISYLEPLSRHRPVQNLYDQVPAFPDSTFIAPTASVIGSVNMGENCSVWYGAVLRGDLSAIRLGNNVSVGVNCVLVT